MIRWRFGATKGDLVAGGYGKGDSLNQLNTPFGITVDSESILVVDSGNDRIMRWRLGATKDEVVVGGNGKGSALNQLNKPNGQMNRT